MKARYQMVKEISDPTPQGKYIWRLLDTEKECFVMSLRGNNPINAPEQLRKLQARLNTRDMLDDPSKGFLP